MVALLKRLDLLPNAALEHPGTPNDRANDDDGQKSGCSVDLQRKVTKGHDEGRERRVRNCVGRDDKRTKSDIGCP